ncbi:MAG: hypothetical protein DRK00_00495 [Thermoprotei archaeon]|nr:MAG: hypothetical protein DRK00_00495 [Thermoprotei archaeon]
MRVLEASATLRVALNSALEARSIAAALSADDEALEDSIVKTRLEGLEVTVEVRHWGSSPIRGVRALLDDVLRVLGALGVE